MAQTRPKPRKSHGNEAFRGVVATGVTIYEGGFGAARGPNSVAVEADSTLAAMFTKYAQTNGLIPWGFWDAPAGEAPETDDDETGTVGNGTKTALIRMNNGWIADLTVVDADSNLDVFKPVYLTDEITPTVTPTTKESHQIGFLMSRRGNSSTGLKSVVYFYSSSELLLQGILGGTVREILLANVDLKSIADGVVIDGLTARNHFEVISAFAVINRVVAGGTSVILSLSNGAGATAENDISDTGITIASADTKGTKKTIADLTGPHDAHFHEGDEINIIAKSTTGTFTDGDVNVYIVVRNLPGY